MHSWNLLERFSVKRWNSIARTHEKQQAQGLRSWL